MEVGELLDLLRTAGALRAPLCGASSRGKCWSGKQAQSMGHWTSPVGSRPSLVQGECSECAGCRLSLVEAESSGPDGPAGFK